MRTNIQPPEFDKEGEIMICPYCNHEMTDGYLAGSRPITFRTNKKLEYTSDEFFYVSKGFLHGCFAQANYCQNCDMIIFKVKESENSETK